MNSRQRVLLPIATAWARRHGAFVAIVVLYVFTATWLAFRIPAFATPNEQFHYEYVALLLRTGRLPDPLTATGLHERHQPPLYYTLAALTGLPFPSPPLNTDFPANPYYLATHEGNRNPLLHADPQTAPVLYAGRLVSILFGVLCLAAIYWAACKTLAPGIGLLVASLTAFQPAFLFFSASLSNDLAVTAMSGLAVAYGSVIVVGHGTARRFFAWGFLCSLAALTKANAILLPGLFPLVYLGARRSRRGASVTRSTVAAAAGFLPLYGAWLIINSQRHIDPAAIGMSLSLDRLLHITAGDLALLRPYVFTLWRSFWLDWSAGGIGYAPDWVYVISASALLVAGWGWLRRGREVQYPSLLPWIHLLWVVPLVIFYLAAKSLMIKDTGALIAEGRWVLPAVPSLAWAAAVGWARLWPQRWRARALAAATWVAIASTLLLLALLLPRFYPPGAQQVANIPRGIQPTSYVFGDVELAGAQIGPLVAGKPTTARLYWRAIGDVDTDYSYAVLTLVPGRGEWQRLDGQHSFPGGGLTPTQGWRRGDLYADPVVVIPQGELNGPVQGVLQVQLFDGKEALAATENGQPVDMAIAQQLVIHPAAMPTVPDNSRLAAPVAFGGVISLVGASATPSKDGLAVTLWWQPISRTEKDYSIFVHLLDAQGRLVAQADSMPDGDRSPTHIWQPGDTIRDVHTLTSDVAHGTVLVGVYDLATLARLNAMQGGQTLPDNAFRQALP